MWVEYYPKCTYPLLRLHKVTTWRP